jgi:RNA polymerase sigma-70 factor (ECF subfamily)
LRITHNTAITTLRRRREEVRDPQFLPEQLARSTTEAEAVDRASIDAFEEALDDLDELSRSIVVLREIEGLSYDEIAEVLDVALPTVKTRLLRARRVLATALEGWRP